MSVIDTLIYDRTQQDLLKETDKAYISYKDLNRIEEAVKYLTDTLNKYSYIATTNNKTNWSIEDIRTQEECNRIKQNFEKLKKAISYNLTIPAFDWNDIQEANRIEKILVDIDSAIKSMEKLFVYSGVAGMGQNRIWQQRFRRYSKSLKQWLELTQTYWSDFSDTQTWEDIIYD